MSKQILLAQALEIDNLITDATCYVGRDGLHIPRTQSVALTVLGEITTSGNASVVLASTNITGGGKTLSVAVVAGTQQVETATVVGTITVAGNAKVTLTSNTLAEDAVFNVPVALNDTASVIAEKIRAYLTDAFAAAAIPFSVGGTGATVVLTHTGVPAENDTTLNLAIEDGTSDGITTAASSANTTAGVARDTAASVADKIRTALNADSDITDYFTVGATGAIVSLTKKINEADDSTLALTVGNGTCAGLTSVTGAVTSRIAVDAVEPIGVSDYEKLTVCVNNGFNNSAKVTAAIYDGISPGFDTDRIATLETETFATTVKGIYSKLAAARDAYTFKGLALKLEQGSTAPTAGKMDIKIYGESRD
jgi:hypothetical protein